MGAVTAVDASLWIRRFHRAPAGAPRLVCFPYAGGSASYFFPVSAALGTTAEVLAVQYPGRQDRRAEPVVEDLVALSEQLAEVLSAEPDRPTVFFGHSMGAVVAYEVARREELRGVTLTHLYASGRRAPADPRPDEDVHTRDDEGLLEELTRLGGPGVEMLRDPEMAAMVLPAVRGDYVAIETYRHRPGTPLHCPVTALVGDSDPRVTLDEARDWARITSGPFDLRIFPGGHFYLGQHIPAVLQILRKTLET